MNKPNPIYYGSDLKLALHVDFGKVPADMVSFEVEFRYGNSILTLNKAQLVKVDANNYLACIKAVDTGKGQLKAFLKAHLPDEDFPDRIHDVVTLIDLNLTIV